jgi:hypothetical protein
VKKLVIFLVALAIIFVVGDFVAKRFAEQKAGDELQTQLELSSTPDVSFSGWPFIVRAVKGEFAEVDVDTRSFEVKDLTFERVHLAMNEVTFSVSDLLRGNADAVQARGGRGSASLSEAELNDALETHGAPFTLKLGDGVAMAELPDGSEIEADLDVTDDVLSIAPQSHAGGVEVGLPALLDNLTYRAVTIEDGSAEVSLTIGPTTLQRALDE